MANYIVGIISLTLGIVVMSGVFMQTIKSTNTTGWGSGEIALWGLLGIAGIAGLVFGVLNVFGLA